MAQKPIAQVIEEMVNAGESDEDIDAVVQSLKASPPAGGPPAASVAEKPPNTSGVMPDDEWAKLSGGQKMRNILTVAGKALGGAFLGPEAATMVDHPKMAIAGIATGHPKVIQGLSKITGPLAAAGPAAVRNAVGDPVSAAFGAYEGYQYGGVPGAVAGGLGLPSTVRGLHRLASSRGGAVGPDAAWQQEARNLNARDKFIAKQAATEAKDLAVHQRMLDKIAQAKSREGIASAKQEWKDILQHAKNLNEAEKATARIAAEKAAEARARELFPDGVEMGPASQRITSRTVRDGVSTTTSQTAKPALSEEAKALMELLQPKMDVAKTIGVRNGVMERTRYLSNKLILTPAEQQELAFLNQRAGVSASEVGMTYAASGKPK